ncbi:PREDICTED: nuclear factor of activated T-cells 5 isoform X2 [Wasmannia auropunctata]|uniref:nuclear factor of activated T-cells 5 isoform X2 n=1 Tax=Wasmannia auropunctata TaxID=64793 RepID=UPI0005EFAB86|nr:PREDICTED: nuclear factor of activated T-cells 5 isoform X2 [Wasmannia auropunctata]
MAPDLEKRRQELRRGSSGTLDHVNDHPGMLLQLRCANGTADPHCHGSNAGGAPSTVTASSVSRTTADNRAHSATRRTVTNNQQRQQQQTPQQQQQSQQQKQQQQQQQQQQPKQSRFPLLSLGGVTARISDEHGPRTGTTPDDNSNDSGLGSEERQQHFNNINLWNNVGEEDSKRRKMDIKLESEDANFAFPEVTPGTSPDNKSPTVRTVNGIGLGGISGIKSGNGSIGRVVGISRPRPAVLSKRTPNTHQGPITLISQLSNVSADGKTQLQIVCQPEQQHRARYQTEGSRGAVKDRSGNGFPIVRLIGYDKPTNLQVFIGTDLGRVAPHMFYQACRVSGKNSTPCIERKLDGTIVIEIDMDPAKDVTCDCVGILKERNVDVEHRFPQEAGLLQGRSKKKSTRCRMVFRTTLTHADGTTETLQVCSQPIVCTQPPGIPEICKKSLTSCPCTGGLELIILGKNFLKDTRVVFQLDSDDLTSSLEPHWECTVLPDKEHLHPVHLVCVIPPYRRQDLAPTETVSVKLFAVSSGKTSEPHTFLYTAVSTPPQPSIGKVESISPSLTNGDASLAASSAAVPLATGIAPGSLLTQTTAGAANFLSNAPAQSQQSTSSETVKSDPSPPPTGISQVTPVMMWTSQSSNSPPDIMMPPPLVANPLMNRRSSSNLQLILPDNLKTEVLDENSQNSMLSENSMQSIPTPTTATNGPTSVTSPLQQLVNENSREAAPSQADIIRTVAAANNSPVQETVSGLLGVVDLIRTQHPLSMVNAHQCTTSFGGMHESTQVQVLSPHRLKDTNSVPPTDNGSNGAALQGAGVVDLRMKHHHHPDFGTLSSFTGASGTQPLSAPSSHVVEKYLNHIETSVGTTEESNNPENEFAMQQQRASIISGSNQQSAAPGILTNAAQTSVKSLDALVNSAAEQLVSPLHSVNPNPTAMLSHVAAEHEPIGSGQQTRTSPPIPVKTMLLEALIPSQTVQPMAEIATTVAPTATIEQTGDNLLTSINAALLPPLPEAQVSAAAATSNTTVAGNVNPAVAAERAMQQQMQALTQQEVAVMQQQVQQVEQVVAQAQQQVEQVVAQAHQQAVQVVHQAQQQVVQQVVQHAQVVQQAVQKVQAVQQVQAAPQMVQEAEEEVQQAVHQATQEVVQQVQAVQQAIQQAQAAQAMQQAVQQDIGSMLSQPANLVAEASSALASGAAQEPSQQRLTNAAEQAINNVITNATKDIINNRPISTTTAHAIIATKKILNSVATQSAQLMNNAMEGILPKSPSAQNNIIEQAQNNIIANKSPPVPVALPVTPNRQTVNAPIPNPAASAASNRKTEDGMLPQELTSMSEHDLLSYINPNCFEQLPQSGFLL